MQTVEIFFVSRSPFYCANFSLQDPFIPYYHSGRHLRNLAAYRLVVVKLISNRPNVERQLAYHQSRTQSFTATVAVDLRLRRMDKIARVACDCEFLPNGKTIKQTKKLQISTTVRNSSNPHKVYFLFFCFSKLHTKSPVF